MIRTPILLLTAAFGLIMSAIAVQAADTNFQIAPPSQKSVPTYTLTDTGSFNPGSGARSASGINFLGHAVGFEVLNQVTSPFLYANGKSVNSTLLLPQTGYG
jgi:hypothetical protein